jgi:putative membrane protein
MHNAPLLADGWHGGPGPWILLAPLFWITVVVFLRRVVLRGRGPGRGPGRGWGPGWGPGAGRAPWAATGPEQWAGPGADRAPAPSPIETLNRRYAEGQIDEFEYRERYDLLNTMAAPHDSAG